MMQALLKRIQMTTQLAARMKHPGLHRTHRAIAQVRHVLNGMSPVVSQQETQSLFVGQTTQALFQPLAFLIRASRVNDRISCFIRGGRSEP